MKDEQILYLYIFLTADTKYVVFPQTLFPEVFEELQEIFEALNL